MVNYDYYPVREYFVYANIVSFSLNLYDSDGPSVETFSCNKKDTQQWIWNATDASIHSGRNGKCLTQIPELEVWAGPLSDAAVAVVLLNRGGTSAPITVHWADVGLPTEDLAIVRDLWTQKNIGPFKNNYTSPNIEPHAVMMLKITLLQ